MVKSKLKKWLQHGVQFSLKFVVVVQYCQRNSFWQNAQHNIPGPSHHFLTWKQVILLHSYDNKRSVLRKQSRDRNRNIKWSVYCQYG